MAGTMDGCGSVREGAAVRSEEELAAANGEDCDESGVDAPIPDAAPALVDLNCACAGIASDTARARMHPCMGKVQAGG